MNLVECSVWFLRFECTGDTLWLLLKEFSTISMEAGVIINGSGLVKVLDATSLIRLMDTLFSTPTPILKLFAEGSA